MGLAGVCSVAVSVSAGRDEVKVQRYVPSYLGILVPSYPPCLLISGGAYKLNRERSEGQPRQLSHRPRSAEGFGVLGWPRPVLRGALGSGSEVARTHVQRGGGTSVASLSPALGMKSSHAASFPTHCLSW